VTGVPPPAVFIIKELMLISSLILFLSFFLVFGLATEKLKVGLGNFGLSPFLLSYFLLSYFLLSFQMNTLEYYNRSKEPWLPDEAADVKRLYND